MLVRWHSLRSLYISYDVFSNCLVNVMKNPDVTDANEECSAIKSTNFISPFLMSFKVTGWTFTFNG